MKKTTKTKPELMLSTELVCTLTRELPDKLLKEVVGAGLSVGGECQNGISGQKVCPAK